MQEKTEQLNEHDSDSTRLKENTSAGIKTLPAIPLCVLLHICIASLELERFILHRAHHQMCNSMQMAFIRCDIFFCLLFDLSFFFLAQSTVHGFNCIYKYFTIVNFTLHWVEEIQRAGAFRSGIAFFIAMRMQHSEYFFSCKTWKMHKMQYDNVG